jgi:selenocysteine lyase/cysteine desulfurase
MQADYWDIVRQGIIGRDAAIETPFGRRRVTYADHTASGRAVKIVEDALQAALPLYGNTHTEDDASGSLTTARLHAAEAAIKRFLHAGPDHRLISVGSGTTAAVHLLQQILGIYVPPAGRELFESLARGALPASELTALSARLGAARPVVFVGPYEHHSNEVSWRECFAEVVEVELTTGGLLDLDDLSAKLRQPEYRGRRLIGAFSAASNVSGVKTPVHQVARILHRAGALAFFDYAASAPYEPIDACRDEESFFDALYFSPHKFLGGPGSCGLLLFHKRIYRDDLPPTVGAGGTVDFVGPESQAYSNDIEVRETPGTPPILQTLRAALAMELKEKLGVERIAVREKELARRVHARLSSHPAILLMGDVAPDDRLPIFSFTVRVQNAPGPGSSWLHPRFVTTLLNDLFGIQSRAGCSCAAPYGHRVLHIDNHTSQELRRSIASGNVGLKPGWTRLNFHFLLEDAEVDFLCRAVLFVAEHGKRFLPLYRFDMHTGAWRHRDVAAPTAGNAAAPVSFGLDANAHIVPDIPLTPGLLDGYLAEARKLADCPGGDWSGVSLSHTEEDLIPFVYVEKA